MNKPITDMQHPKMLLDPYGAWAAKEGVPMGHAGALVFGDVGTFESKRKRLEAAGAQVFASIEDLIAACRKAHG